MADEGPLIALVGSAIPRDDQGGQVDDPAREARIRAACMALGRALAGAGCRLLVYSSDPYFIEADVVAGYAAIAKTPGSIRFVRPEDDDRDFAEQGDKRTRPLFEVKRDDSQDWEVSFYRSLEEADGVLLLSGGSSTLIAGHVAMILGRPIAPIGAFGGMARKLRNHLVRVQSNVGQSEQEALSEFDGGDPAVAIVAGLKHRCEVVAAARRQKDEQAERLAAAHLAGQEELAQLKNTRAMRRQVLQGTTAFGVISLVLLAIGLGLQPSGFFAYGLILIVLAAGGGVGACLRLTRTSSGSDPSTAMVVGPIAGALCSLSYVIPHWMSSSASFELGKMLGGWLVMIWLVAVGGGLAADAVIDSLRRGAEKHAQEVKPSLLAGAAPAAVGAAAAAEAAPAEATPDGRQKRAGRARKAR
jgi:hypothetical protein